MRRLNYIELTSIVQDHYVPLTNKRSENGVLRWEYSFLNGVCSFTAVLSKTFEIDQTYFSLLVFFCMKLLCTDDKWSMR